MEQLNTKLDLALAWTEKSELLAQEVTKWNAQFYPKDYIMGHLYWTKAKLLSRSGDTKGAINYADQMMKLGDKPLFFNRKKDREPIDKKLAAWKAQRSLQLNLFPMSKSHTYYS